MRGKKDLRECLIPEKVDLEKGIVLYGCLGVIGTPLSRPPPFFYIRNNLMLNFIKDVWEFYQVQIIEILFFGTLIYFTFIF